jgi:hypothetical protein
MRVIAVCVLVGGALVASARTAAARPTVAIAGIEAAGDSVGVDVEAVGVARELSRAIRRSAERPELPLQPVDPMVVADDVEALVWGKLTRDGDAWVVSVHLSAVGADGDTVSYRAVIKHDKTSSLELARWGTIIYDSLLDQIDIDDKDDVAPNKAPAPAIAPVATESEPPHPNQGPVDPFAAREPSDPPIVDDPADPFAAPQAEPADEPEAILAIRDPGREPPEHAGARRLFWISAGVAAAGAVFWIHAAFQIDDAEDQLDNLAGCSNCDRAIEAANAKGNRWEGLSWLAGTATVAGVAAAALFGYQGYVVGRRPAPRELVGAHGTRRRAVTWTPVLGPDRVGAGVSVAF